MEEGEIIGDFSVNCVGRLEGKVDSVCRAACVSIWRHLHAELAIFESEISVD